VAPIAHPASPAASTLGLDPIRTAGTEAVRGRLINNKRPLDAEARDAVSRRRAGRAPNPASLHENITAFRRLLDHNPRARIVWVHAGWDLTGERTVALMRSLLEAHRNLR